MIFLPQDLGLGGAIICHAVVKTIAVKYSNETILIPILDIYKPSYKQLYQGYDNIQFEQIQYINNIYRHESQYIINKIQELLKKYQHNILKQSKLEASFIAQNLHITKKFAVGQIQYYAHKINFADRYKIPTIKRNYEIENMLYQKYSTCNPYTIIIQDKNRIEVGSINNKMLINRNKINVVGDIITIPPILSDNIFDYLTLIQKAKEFHTIPTSMAVVADQCANFKEHNFFVHNYTRKSQYIHPAKFENSKVSVIW